jgi:hypothetical protein
LIAFGGVLAIMAATTPMKRPTMRPVRIALAAVLLIGAAGAATLGAPAAVAASGRFSTATSTVGEILDNPAAKAVVDKHLSTVFANPQIRMARPLTLKGLQRFAKDSITDAALAAIDKDFAALSAKK